MLAVIIVKNKTLRASYSNYVIIVEHILIWYIYTPDINLSFKKMQAALTS